MADLAAKLMSNVTYKNYRIFLGARDDVKSKDGFKSYGVNVPRKQIFLA